jgi:hypothetical protein
MHHQKMTDAPIVPKPRRRIKSLQAALLPQIKYKLNKQSLPAYERPPM